MYFLSVLATTPFFGRRWSKANKGPLAECERRTLINGTAAPQLPIKFTKKSYPRPKMIWADNMYHKHSLNEWISIHGWYVIEVKSHLPGSEGYLHESYARMQF